LNKTVYHICEYGIISCSKEYNGINSLSNLYLIEEHFDSLFNYISHSQDYSNEADKPFSLYYKGTKRQIRIKNHVGVIETKEGVILEILPKIHLNRSKDELNETKQIFFKMLKHLKNSPFVQISNAHLDAKKDFPILEVFIQSFISETEKLLSKGLKFDYIQEVENINYLKGKILINQNLKYNYSNHSQFYCEYSIYSNNIPHNKILKATLLKLINVTSSFQSYSSIMKILAHFDDVQPSLSFTDDFAKIRSSGRLFEYYEKLMKWSDIFLNGKSFMNFSGSNLNIAILYPMERLFEDYISFLFSKYSDKFEIKLQDRSYFLVTQKNLGKFRLKPDIVVKEAEVTRKIIDTKWKLLDQFSEKKNYNISQADMYQLYAYGKKYEISGSEPNLLLIYPSNPNFTKTLENFIYEGDLKLQVYPFDFNLNEETQIRNMLL
jgi:5-methylcytosine-specific restriction enzyme subunit McrC